MTISPDQLPDDALSAASRTENDGDPVTIIVAPKTALARLPSVELFSLVAGVVVIDRSTPEKAER